MKDIKVIVTDMDGTLLTSEHIISSKTKEILIDYQEKGTSLILASGRNIDSLMKLGKELHIHNYPQSGYICLNGLEIRDAYGDCLLREKQLTYEEVQRLDEIVLHYQLDVVLFFENEIYVVEHGHTGIMEYHFLTSDQYPVESLNDIPQDKFITLKKMALLQESTKMSECLPRIQKETEGLYELNLVESDWVEVCPFGVNKGTALEKYAKLKGLSLNDFIAFGNGENDISMLQTAGLGVAMENSFESVKAIADDICLDNDHDGIGEYLKG